jgi:hypothetical protein
MSPARADPVARLAIDRAVALPRQSFPHCDQSTGRQPRRRHSRSAARV